MIHAAKYHESQAAELMAKAAIRQGSRPSEMTREKQDLVNSAGDHRVAAHKIRQAEKKINKSFVRLIN